jgi:hypothetical protein
LASAYTPGLTVSGDTVVQKVRRLPIKGEVLVKEGDTVAYDQSVAKADLPGLLQTLRIAEKLGIEAKDVEEYFQLKEGDPITKGDLVAETPGLFGLGWFKQEIHAEYTGVVESVSKITGNALIREPAIPVEIPAYVDGKVIDTIPEEGVVVETRGAMVQGIFGIGGERSGTLRTAVDDHTVLLEASHIKDDDAGKLLIGGSGVSYEALERAAEVGVAGLVVGAVKDVDLMELLGYDIGVAITGQEEISFTLIATEGFGQLAMADRTFELLKSLEGNRASINGATQIRAGVIRPEVICPIHHAEGDPVPEHSASILEIGTPIRIIREPYFGELGQVTGLPAELQAVESGAMVRVLSAKLASGDEVTVPRANVEIITTS